MQQLSREHSRLPPERHKRYLTPVVSGWQIQAIASELKMGVDPLFNEARDGYASRPARTLVGEIACAGSISC